MLRQPEQDEEQLIDFTPGHFTFVLVRIFLFCIEAQFKITGCTRFQAFTIWAAPLHIDRFFPGNDSRIFVPVFNRNLYPIGSFCASINNVSVINKPPRTRLIDMVLLPFKFNIGSPANLSLFPEAAGKNDEHHHYNQRCIKSFLFPKHNPSQFTKEKSPAFLTG